MARALGRLPVDTAIPTPPDVLGVELGQRPLRPDEVLRYLEALAAASQRVALTRYGATGEGRPLVRVSISSEEHVGRLEEIAAETRRLGDPRLPSTGAARPPASVWVGCGIHGDELSGVDAGVALAYRLAAGTDDLAERIRRHLVVHLDPCVNPDGRERALAQVTSWTGRIPDLDPAGLVHALRWPHGRGNHYLFDLNRDMVPQVHVETRARTAAFLERMPQLVIELHEMDHDETFLFASPGDPLNPYLPDHSGPWWDRLARAGADALREVGTSTYRGEWNEVFYPGYMDIWPAYHGAVATIFEEAGTRGTSIRQHTGRVRTYADSVGSQSAALVAYLDTAAAGADRLLSDWAAARRRAVEERAGRRELGYRLRAADPARIRWLVDALLHQGIEVQHDPQAPGEFVVRLDQPTAPLVRNLLDREVPLPAEFVTAERARLEATGEGVIYDVTAWSLPLATGIDAELLDTMPPGAWESISALPPVGGGAGDGPAGRLFLDDGMRVTAPLLEGGARLHVALDAFTNGGRDWPRGTLFLPRGENDAAIIARLEALAVEHGVVAHGVETTLSTGSPDLGGHRFPLLVPPRVGVFGGDGVESTSYGAVWHLLDTAGTPMSGLDVTSVRASDLGRFNVLVLPDTGGDAAHDDVLGGATIERLRAWLTMGGTLIGLAGGARFLAREHLGLIGTRSRADATVTPYMPHGAFVWAEASQHHWLTLGSPARLAVMHRTTEVLEAASAAEVPVRFAGAEDLHAAGLVWPEAAALIGGTPAVVRERLGDGQVILFPSTPAFRGYTLATARILMNAIHLGPGLGATSPNPW